MAHAQQLIIQLSLNANRSVSKTCKISPIESNDKFYKKLIQIAKQKLRIKRKKKDQPFKLYLIQTGQLITTSNVNELISHEYAEHFNNNLSIAVSLGEEYQGKILKEKEKEMIKEICLIRYMTASAQVSSDACKQLEACQRLKGMKLVCGQPDLHPGKGYPIGVSLVSDNIVYPYLIGNDIGCGMSLIETPVTKNTAFNTQKINSWIKDINIDDSWIASKLSNDDKHKFMNKILENKLIDWPKGQHQDGIDVEQVSQNGLDIHNFDESLGTIGSGNHFAELQCIDQIIDEELFNELGLNADKLFLMVHSGSRGMGKAVLDNYLKTHSAKKGLNTDCEEFDKYLCLHNNALKWARKNRMIIAQRFISCMGYDFDKCVCHIDIYHNYLAPKNVSFFKDVEREIESRKIKPKLSGKHDENENKKESENANDENKEQTEENENERKQNTELLETEEIKNNNDLNKTWWIHRKGAAPSDSGYVVIPGSRGSYSYIVKPIASSYSVFSIAHGAGRKLMRSNAVKKISKWYPNVNVLQRTDMKSYVICENKQLMYEEHPSAYKNITNVIQDLETHNLIKTVAILKPIITYKTKSK